MADTENNKNSNSPASTSAPALRFPGFTEDWESINIGKATIKVGSGSTPRGGASVYTDSGHPFVRSQNIGDGELLLDGIVYISETLHNKQKGTEIKPYDVLLNITGASIGRCSVADARLIGGNVNQHVCIIRANETLNPIFLANFLRSPFGQKQIESFQVGGNREGLNFEQIRSIKFKLPTCKEQGKIASLFQILDERIATQRRLIDKLETLIKGITVFLTTNTPNTKIADCLVCHSSTLQENQAESSGKYPVYGASGICGYTDFPDVTVDSILIVKDGSGVGSVAYVSGGYSVIGTSNYLTAKNGYLLRYLYYCLMCFNFTPYKTGMAIPHIYFKDYGKAKIYCPSIETQSQIATALSNIESKIEIERTILQQYAMQKQHLLQQMFI